MSPSSRFWLLALMFGAITFTHCRSPVTTPFDSRYSIHLALSLLQEHDLDLDEYRGLIQPGDYRVIEADGHLYSRYPVGPSLLAVPIVALAEGFSQNVLHVPFSGVVQTRPSGVERLCGSLFVAATALVLFSLCRQRLAVGPSLLIVFVFAFCTSSWSVVSRALWQHGPSMLALSLALWALLRARDQPNVAQYAGLCLAVAVVMRPTDALAAVLLTLYVGLEHRDQLVRFLGWAASIAVPFLLLNLLTVDSILPGYYLQHHFRFSWRFLEGLAGTLISPGRGLFIYSSVFVFSLLGMVQLLRHRRWTRLDTFLAAWLLLHWLLISSWDNWWGGTVFGPRLFADLIPVLVYFLIPVFERWSAASGGRWPLTAGLAITVAASFLIHGAGATDWGPWQWNFDGTHIDADHSRLWDWRDPPFLRRYAPHVGVPVPPTHRLSAEERQAEQRRLQGNPPPHARSGSDDAGER